MPRNVRNFWIELEVDGKKQKIATGPTSKDGGFRLRILQRKRGDIVHVMSVEGSSHPDGTLTLLHTDHVQRARSESSTTR